MPGELSSKIVRNNCRRHTNDSDAHIVLWRNRLQGRISPGDERESERGQNITLYVYICTYAVSELASSLISSRTFVKNDPRRRFSNEKAKLDPARSARTRAAQLSQHAPKRQIEFANSCLNGSAIFRALVFVCRTDARFARARVCTINTVSSFRRNSRERVARSTLDRSRFRRSRV